MDQAARDTLDFRPTERLRAPAPDGLLVAGYATGVLLPVVGFFLGFALVLKNRVAHGIAVMVLSVVVAGFAAALVVAGTGDDTASSSTADCIDRALLPEGALKCVE